MLMHKTDAVNIALLDSILLYQLLRRIFVPFPCIARKTRSASLSITNFTITTINPFPHEFSLSIRKISFYPFPSHNLIQCTIKFALNAECTKRKTGTQLNNFIGF